MLRALSLSLILTACSAAGAAPGEGSEAAGPPGPGQAVAIFAGGCFWCMESAFEGQPGVLEVLSGYTGGPEQHPTYRQVSSHLTGHYEAVRVLYDPAATSYEALLDQLWHNIDPTQGDGQFCDRGPQYRSAIFTSDPAEIAAAERSRAAAAETLGREVVTEILPAATFWVAEDYHQDFYEKQPARYASYREGCGRDRRLEQLWGEAAGGETIAH